MISKQKKEPHSAFFLLIIILIIMSILTFFIPAGAYETKEVNGKNIPISGTYKITSSNPQGLWEILKAPLDGFNDAIGICVYVLVIGGFLSVVKSTKSIDNGIKALVKKLQGKEVIFIPIIVFLMGSGGLSFGLEEETTGFIGLFITFFISAGYDSALAVLCLLPAAITGISGAQFNPFSIGVASHFLNVNMFSGASLRALIYFLYETILSIYIIRYALKIKKDPKKSIVYDELENLKKEFSNEGLDKDFCFTKKNKIILSIFGLTYLFMILSIIPWSSYGITFFTKINDFFINLKLFGKPIAFGDWWFTETPILFMVSAVVCGKIAGYKEPKITRIFIEGVKELLPVCLIVAFSRGISIILKNGHIDATILHFGEINLQNTNNVLFVTATYLFYIPLNMLITSTSALATLTMPILGPLSHFKGIQPGLMLTAYSCSFVTVNIITPASGVLMALLSISKISYVKWIKLIGPYILITFVLNIIILSLSTYFGI